ncbi:MAG TPA: plasmid mobilization relaxosome protein MobC [Ignavibacteriaceae bacterium]
MEEKESKPKGKGGRPLKKVKKDNVMRVRLSDAEKFLIVEKAKKAGMKPSEWFRATAKKAVILARISPEDLALFRVLTGMANNLNQLTKQAHQFGLIMLVQSYQDLLIAIDETLQRFNRD